MRLSPEISLVVSPRLCLSRGPRKAVLTLVQMSCLVTPGLENMANDHKGSPGTWEILIAP